MRLPRFNYVKPVTLEEGLDVLQECGSKAKILAGGTDLIINMKHKVVRPEKVISIKSLPDLCSIAPEGKDQLNIGSCVTLSDSVANGVLTEEFPALRQALQSVASKHIRNVATIGGNICLDNRCWYYNQSKLWRDSREPCYKVGGRLCHAIKGSERCHAINSSDTAPVLIALGAQIKLAKKGHERIIPLKDFYLDNGAQPTSREPEEMVTSISIPKSTESNRTTFIKVSMRKGLDFAMGSIAGCVTRNGKGGAEVVLVLGSLASRPIVLKKAPQVIKDAGFTEGSIEKAALTARSELGSLTNLFTSAGYKRHLAEVLVKRALGELTNHNETTGRTKR
jgi:4-hydroxybenzoyl-CoA reductase beta subunit